MTTLITGAGLIGTLTARHLMEQGAKAVLFDVNPQPEAVAKTVYERGRELGRGRKLDV